MIKHFVAHFQFYFLTVECYLMAHQKAQKCTFKVKIDHKSLVFYVLVLVLKVKKLLGMQFMLILLFTVLSNQIYTF